MAIYDYLPKFNYIEPNNLKGLLPGFVVAQVENVDQDLLNTEYKVNGEAVYFENGKLCTLAYTEENGVVIKAAASDAPAVYIHFTEPLNTIRNSDQYFAVNVKNECPRLVQLIPGDEWMSTEDLGDEILGGRVVKVKAKEGWFAVDYMANGDHAYHYMFLG